MENSQSIFTMVWDKVNLNLNGKVVEYPLLRIKIAGAPSLVEFISFMSKVESFTEDYQQDYISLTDFSDLYPNKITELLISISSSKLIRSITFVTNQAKMSFVVLGKDSRFSILEKQLKDVNNSSEEKGYSYNYHFIEDESQMKDIAEKFLMEKKSEA